MSTRIQIRRGTSSQWTFANPTLSNGELGFETDTYLIKVGDGTTAWTSLDYFADIDSASASLIGYIDERIEDVVGLSPETLDTLEELAAALGDDPNFFNTIGASVTSASAFALAEANNYTDSALENIDALPDQTGNDGKFLSTDGNTASWTTVETGASSLSTINTISGSSEYTLELSDANSIIEMNSSGSNILTIPVNSTEAFEIGTSVDVVQTGVGQTSIVSGSVSILDAINSAATWTTVTSNFSSNFTSFILSIAYGNDLWVAGTYNGQMRTSTDTTTWTTVTSNFGDTTIESIAYGENLWVAVGRPGQIRTSTDATTWTTVTSNFVSSQVRSVAFGNDLWVAGGTTGQIRTSTNGSTWTTVTSNFGNTEIRSISYGNDLWVAGGLSGQIRTSTDATTWTTVNSNFGNTVIESIAYGDDLWVAGGRSGQIRTSTDATTWTTVTSNFGNTTIESIAYGDDLWVAGGRSGQIRTSTDATTWTTVTSNFGNTNILSIAYGDDLWVAGGYYGQMRTSENVFINNVATINSKDNNNKISSQYGAATLYKRGTDEWVMIGDLTS